MDFHSTGAPRLNRDSILNDIIDETTDVVDVIIKLSIFFHFIHYKTYRIRLQIYVSLSFQVHFQKHQFMNENEWTFK